MKAQCVHFDSGVCETCFTYEQKIDQLEAERDKFKEDAAHREMEVLSLERKVRQAKTLLYRCREVLETLFKWCQDEGWKPIEGEQSEIDRLLVDIDEAGIK